MCTAAQSVSTQLQLLPKSSTKRKPKLQLPIEPLDNSKVQVEINGYKALALVDLQTKGGDLINSQFVYPCKIPMKSIEKKSLSTAIKGSRGTIDETCEVDINWMGYVETITFYVAHLASCDLILGQLAMESVRAVIPAGQNPVTIQPNGMPRFSLTPCQRLSTSKNATAGIASAVLEVTNILTTDSTSLEDTIDPAIHTTWYAEQEDVCIIVNASSVTPNFNPVKEFPELFPEDMPKEMPTHRAINHVIRVKEGSTWKPTFKPTQN